MIRKLKYPLFLLAMTLSMVASADENSFRNIFCKSAEIRSDLYRIYEKNKEEFVDALNTSLGSGDCVWKDYGLDKKLTTVYRFNDTQTMTSAEFDGETLYSITFNEYLN